MPYLEVLQKYAVFDARASRSEYWLFVSIHLVIVATLVTLSLVVGDWLIGVCFLYVLGTVIPSLAVTVRRLHDIGRNGWHTLLVLVVLLGWIVLLVFILMGSDDSNEYGPRPA